jgi:hypothetical protein
MKKIFIVSLVLLSLFCIVSTSNAGPVQDLINAGYIQVQLMNGGGANVFIRNGVYVQMSYNEKLGLCLHIMGDYGVSSVYGWKWKAYGNSSPSPFDMLFVHSSPEGFRVYR